MKMMINFTSGISGEPLWGWAQQIEWSAIGPWPYVLFASLEEAKQVWDQYLHIEKIS